MEIENNMKSENIEEFEEPLAQPGKIFPAEIHGSAQRFLKIKKLSKYIRFCKCCLLPTETPGVVVPYTCLDSLEDFGIGLHLYFVYIKFCIVITFIGLLLASIPSMVFTRGYYEEINDFCENFFESHDIYAILNGTDSISLDQLEKIKDVCEVYYITDESKTSDIPYIKIEWIRKFNGGNIANYYDLFKVQSLNPDNVNHLLLDYSLLYFLTAIILLIINFFFIHYVNLIDDKEDFESTTPRDFTLLIKGVQRPNKTISNIQHLKNIINEISENHVKVKVHQIIPCYNLVKLYKLVKNVFEDKIRIYHAYNFKRQKNLHKEYSKYYDPGDFCHYYTPKYGNITKLNNNTNHINNNKEIYINNVNEAQNNSQLNHFIDKKQVTWTKLNEDNDEIFIHDEKLNYYTKKLWQIKATPLNEIEQRIAKNKREIQQLEKDLDQNPDKYSSGTYFVVFKYIIMKNHFYDFFPTNFFSKLFLRIKYFFQNIIFRCCVSEETKRLNYLRTEIRVELPTEAYEVIWQNMGFTNCQKILYKSFTLIVSIILIGISFGVVSFLNYIQFNLTDKETENLHHFYEYLLSFIISIVISLLNSLARKLLKLLTKRFEPIETKTDYYISLSTKFTIFTFINTDIIPLLSNYLHSDENDNDILLNNMLVIFITNFTLNPIVFYLNTNTLCKLCKRARARMRIEGLPLEDSVYTQDELNRLFQNPSMSLCYKYSFFSNILLTSFFYLSVLPLGIVFSLAGCIISYFLEIAHLQFYKRPEVLNSKLCKYFISHFNVAIALWAIGDYFFLRKAEKHYSTFSLLNLILFIVIIFIPYHSFRFNLLGFKEGEITKGSYEEYELIFATDYEKQNPLTKKEGMIKYITKLRDMNHIDKIQYQFLMNNINKESSMVNYYKTSRNVGNILNYYEFQHQFIRLKKKFKFVKEMKRKKRKINKYDIYIEQKARERRAILASINLRNSVKSQATNEQKNIKNYTNDEIDDYSHLGYNRKYNIKGFMEDNPKFRRRISVRMREALFENVKEQGLYSVTEEESGDEDENTIKTDILNKSSKNDNSNWD